MNIGTQKHEFINNLGNYSDVDLADLALHIWVEQQERSQADWENLHQTVTDLHLARTTMM
jgi:hypothetical protein